MTTNAEIIENLARNRGRDLLRMAHYALRKLSKYAAGVDSEDLVQATLLRVFKAYVSSGTDIRLDETNSGVLRLCGAIMNRIIHNLNSVILGGDRQKPITLFLDDDPELNHAMEGEIFGPEDMIMDKSIPLTHMVEIREGVAIAEKAMRNPEDMRAMWEHFVAGNTIKETALLLDDVSSARIVQRLARARERASRALLRSGWER